MADVTLTIDGQPVTVPAGTTLLKAAAEIGQAIPTICYHEHCTANGLCRMCVVEVEGARLLQPACLVPAAEGMRVKTRSERVERSRRTIVEMLNASVDLSQAPEIQTQLQDYGADRARFPEAERRERPVIDDNPMYVRDYAKCILCWRCVQVCADDAQYTFALTFDGRGYETQIGTFFDKPMPATTCVFCGQCVGVCPTNALKPKREWLLELGQTPDEIMAQTRSGRRRRRAP
ncbi:MAG: (2Fe-2S)-binding protein [Anaerolineales bacterium]|nr:(2Fe-2S)-binding protein [Anaerolineales bacterium]